jgi:uncharacterized protein
MLELGIVFVVGIVAGFINVGAGGGSFLTLPLLIFLGLPPSVANGTNRLSIFVMTIVSMATFKKQGVSNVKFSAFLAIPAIVGAYFGSKLSITLDPQLFKQILSVLMFVMIGFILLFTSKDRSQIKAIYGKNRLLLSFIGFFFVGLYGGFIQAGVGYLMIILLSGIHRLSLLTISNIRVTVVFMFTVVALGVFLKAGYINWSFALFLSAGTSIGGWAGTHWNVKKGDKGIKYVLVVSMLIMAIKLWVT